VKKEKGQNVWVAPTAGMRIAIVSEKFYNFTDNEYRYQIKQYKF
jgi:hypothetical protein